MNEMQIFNSPEFGDVRTVIIDGEPWFVGKDVCITLGYARPDNAVTERTDEDDRIYVDSKTRPEIREEIDYRILGQRGGWIVNESGLYSLIFGSKLESAKKFKKWVTGEVLPQLRKTGAYSRRPPLSTAEQIRLLAQGNVELHQRVDELNDRMDKWEYDLPLLPADAEQVSNSAKRRGVEILGGKNAPAYKNASIRLKVFRNLYIYLDYSFGVPRYKEIRRRNLKQAIEIAATWNPPEYLASEIAQANGR